MEFTQVKNQMKNNPVLIDATGFVARDGKKTSIYPTSATAIAALVHQMETQ